MSEIPLNILHVLRERQGLEPDDASKDDEFKQLTPMMKFREWCAWEMGNDTWADSLINTMRDCGFNVVAGDGSDEQES